MKTKNKVIKEVEYFINGKYNLGINDTKIVRDCINKTLAAINYTGCYEELICDHCDSPAENVVSMCGKCDSNING